MDYDDEILNMENTEAEVLEEEGIEANLGTVEVSEARQKLSTLSVARHILFCTYANVDSR